MPERAHSNCHTVRIRVRRGAGAEGAASARLPGKGRQAMSQEPAKPAARRRELTVDDYVAVILAERYYRQGM